ncbi:hypothetical protein FA95DRAFT_850178 [Auriscalpium vulgare]|uniref:Uncharacterized protein n=1 Tax=Auriscalpium vulgare TaxID=40419 RepID=A0ACB8R9R2_9AGAM|nr:hypothetical protein FA95DRAFT_850178 [Auriscalpium vulgare]
MRKTASAGPASTGWFQLPPSLSCLSLTLRQYLTSSHRISQALASSTYPQSKKDVYLSSSDTAWNYRFPPPGGGFVRTSQSLSLSIMLWPLVISTRARWLVTGITVFATVCVCNTDAASWAVGAPLRRALRRSAEAVVDGVAATLEEASDALIEALEALEKLAEEKAEKARKAALEAEAKEAEAKEAGMD